MSQGSKPSRIEVLFRKSKPIAESEDKYPELAPGVVVENGIRVERDLPVKMRDGITIYTDVYRPDGANDLPAIVGWSPYGKRAGYAGMKIPGVPEGTVSPMAKFEGPDPAYWCRNGYAVVNPDARGAGNSEGDILFFSPAEGQDCHDLIEWVAAREWSNGKVGLSGNSWLAASQWYTAAEHPPHLAAIAPWEGFDDYYRDTHFCGGIPETGFLERVMEGLCGPGRVEDVLSMLHRYPLMNEYWQEKVAQVENIEVPAYVVASWTNGLHVRGTFDGFRRIASKDKWLRVHNTHEWPDYYDANLVQHLRRFFDRYLKGIQNGWERTERVHLSVLDPGGLDEVNRPEKEWPLQRTQYETLYLDGATGTLSQAPVNREFAARYPADENGQLSFVIRFAQDTELTGYMKLRLWVEADGSDDMDLFVVVQKLDEQGLFLPCYAAGHIHNGAPGGLRVSHREFDPERSTPAEPYLTHRREQLLQPKQIVPVEIGLWPMGMLWHSGQQLQVVVAGHSLLPPWEPRRYELRNRGHHIIHTGGKYDSHLLVPRIPRKRAEPVRHSP